jgi:hypothetical protein
MSSVQRDAIVSPAAGLTIYNNTINAFQIFNGKNWYSTVHYIGENYGGGIVFYVYDNGQHGLIAYPGDGGPLVWNCGGATQAFGGSANACFNCTPAKAIGTVGSGKTNTILIMTSPGGDCSAASGCAKTSITYYLDGTGITYEDWYLPSIDELNLLYFQRTVVGGFSQNAYWSSTEYGTNTAWWQTFFDGLQSSAPKSNSYLVRPIRAF